MCSNKNNCRNRNQCRKHKQPCGSKPDPVPTPNPIPTPTVTPTVTPTPTTTPIAIPTIDLKNVIPIIPMDQLPGPNTLKNGSMYLIGNPMSVTDPMPDARKYQLAVSNGDFYFAFSPSMLLA